MTDRLRRQCAHGRYEEHWFDGGFPEATFCPGGEFIPEGALVIEKVEPELIDRIEKHMRSVDRNTSRRLTYHDLAGAAVDALRETE